jgi:hypothetical protein
MQFPFAREGTLLAPRSVMRRTLVLISLLLLACNSSALPSNGDGSTPPKCEVNDAGGTAPVLTLDRGQPDGCPCTWPYEKAGTPCDAPMICSYSYPPGTHPSGCGAACNTGDGGSLRWDVAPCI